MIILKEKRKKEIYSIRTRFEAYDHFSEAVNFAQKRKEKGSTFPYHRELTPLLKIFTEVILERGKSYENISMIQELEKFDVLLLTIQNTTFSIRFDSSEKVIDLLTNAFIHKISPLSLSNLTNDSKENELIDLILNFDKFQSLKPEGENREKIRQMISGKITEYTEDLKQPLISKSIILGKNKLDVLKEKLKSYFIVDKAVLDFNIRAINSFAILGDAQKAASQKRYSAAMKLYTRVGKNLSYNDNPTYYAGGYNLDSLKKEALSSDLIDRMRRVRANPDDVDSLKYFVSIINAREAYSEVPLNIEADQIYRYVKKTANRCDEVSQEISRLLKEGNGLVNNKKYNEARIRFKEAQKNHKAKPMCYPSPGKIASLLKDYQYPAEFQDRMAKLKAAYSNGISVAEYDKTYRTLYAFHLQHQLKNTFGLEMESIENHILSTNYELMKSYLVQFCTDRQKSSINKKILGKLLYQEASLPVRDFPSFTEKLVGKIYPAEAGKSYKIGLSYVMPKESTKNKRAKLF